MQNIQLFLKLGKAELLRSLLFLFTTRESARYESCKTIYMFWRFGNRATEENNIIDLCQNFILCSLACKQDYVARLPMLHDLICMMVCMYAVNFGKNFLAM